MKLGCFSLASFFLINSSLALIVHWVTPAAVRFVSRFRPRTAARFLLSLRFVPGGLALFAVAGLCVPSYFWFEPKEIHEELGFLGWTLAWMCIFALVISTGRAFRVSFATRRFARVCRRQGRAALLPEGYGVFLLDSDETLLATVGVIQPQIVISSRVLRNLSTQELAVALEHERAHLMSRDNAKRLLMLLAPDVPFSRCFASLERSWIRFTEWAADDQAAAGDSQRRLSLASALIQMTKLGLPSRHTFALSFVADDIGLSARVDRLLEEKSVEDHFKLKGQVLLGAATLITLLVAAMMQPSVWYTVHQLFEHLVR